VWRNYGGVIIGSSKRADLADGAAKSNDYYINSSLETPGPGAYRVQSDFGLYDPNEAAN
jgi:hypothetical protein